MATRTSSLNGTFIDSDYYNKFKTMFLGGNSNISSYSQIFNKEMESSKDIMYTVSSN
jgi:hypothetical protein